MSEELKALIVDQYISGISIKRLEQMHRMDHRTIRAILVKVGVFKKIVNQHTSNPEHDFAQSFDAKYQNRFEYVSGYVNCESKISIRCLTCGDVFIKTAHNYIASKSDIPTCAKCVESDKVKKQAKANDERIALEVLRVANRYAIALQSLTNVRTHICEWCGKSYTVTKGSKKYCSSECMNKSYNKLGEIRRQRKLKSNGKVENISLPVLFKRDKGICHICGEQCDYDDCEWIGNVFYAHDNYPSIDHVIPLSLGGTHEWTNVRLAHRRCNSIKSDATSFVMSDGRTKLYL